MGIREHRGHDAVSHYAPSDPAHAAAIIAHPSGRRRDPRAGAHRVKRSDHSRVECGTVLGNIGRTFGSSTARRDGATRRRPRRLQGLQRGLRVLCMRILKQA